jgi:CMP-N-acetylneuraminic acid synthetase
MNAVAFVPIKLNSTRIENKNITDLGGKPLCSYVFEALKESGLKEIFVYCSDEKIKNYIPNFVKFLARDERLDQDKTKGIEICNSFCGAIDADVYVLAHATSPFLKSDSIKTGLESIKKGHDSSLSVNRVQTFIWHKGLPLNYNLTDVPRTQDIDPIFIETSGFYIFKKEVIKSGRRVGKNPFFVELDHIESIDIDEKRDLDFARTIMGAR